LKIFNWPFFLLSIFSSPGVHSVITNFHRGTLQLYYSWQLWHPSCAKCQRKDGSPTHHPSSESSWLVMGKFYFFFWCTVVTL